MYQEQCPSHLQQMDRLLSGFTKDSFTFICGRYQENSDRCHRIMDKLPSSNNMTTFCEVIRTSTDSDNGNINKPNKFYPTKQQQQQWSTMTINQRSKLNGLKSRDDTQIRCVYEFVVNNLQRKTRYGFIIQAFNAKGTGPVSTEVYAQTLLKGNISY